MAEVAGLALAVFPLLVKGIVAYVDANRVLQGVLEWRLGMKCLLRELEMENVLFQNTCTHVLNGICQPEQAMQLLRGEGWDDDFGRHVQECWGERNAKAFIEGVEQMGVVLWEVEKKLGFDDGLLPVCRIHGSNSGRTDS